MAWVLAICRCTRCPVVVLLPASKFVVLQIKVTKLNNYEANYEKRVSEARAKEVFYLRRELAVWASTLFIMVLSPVLATASTFAVYVLVSEDNILTAATSFSVLLLFAALRFPINYAGRLVGSTYPQLVPTEFVQVSQICLTNVLLCKKNRIGTSTFGRQSSQ